MFAVYGSPSGPSRFGYNTKERKRRVVLRNGVIPSRRELLHGQAVRTVLGQYKQLFWFAKRKAVRTTPEDTSFSIPGPGLVSGRFPVRMTAVLGIPLEKFGLESGSISLLAAAKPESHRS